MPPFNSDRQNIDSPAPDSGYPDLKPHLEKILIIAKTTPLPSVSHRELVCTAGVTQSGKLIRLYPVPFRYMDYSKWYKQYQWIEIKIEKHGSKRDNRIDSYEPNIDTLKVIGEPLPGGKWTERKEIVLPLVSKSLEELEDNFKKYKISLGIFKPREIKLSIGKETEDWSTRHQQVLRQRRLFETQPKELEKMPFKFSYEFLCNDERCKKSHSLKIIDWGLSELYRKLKYQHPYSQDVILKKIKQKYETEMWGVKKDSYLMLGTHFPYPTFMTIGVFWPPKT